jgi:hypothetical protein
MKFWGEFTDHYVGEILTWKEYAINLDLSSWHWTNCVPWEDREVIELGNNLFAIPVYAKDIYNDPEVSVVELPNNCLALSWDNFYLNGAVIKNEGTDEPVGWLLVEQLGEYEFGVVPGAGNPFESLEELRDYLEEVEREERQGKLNHTRGTG